MLKYSLWFVWGFTLIAGAQDVPAEFEGPVLQEVLSGKMVMTDLVNTKLEVKSVLRAYFPKTSPEAYQALVVQHARYPEFTPKFKSAKTTLASSDQTIFAYWADMVVKVGFLSQHVYPEGRHTLTAPVDAHSEGHVLHEITNYQDMLNIAQESTRLIPYEDGILIYSDVHCLLKHASAQAGILKSELRATFLALMQGFRRTLSDI